MRKDVWYGCGRGGVGVGVFERSPLTVCNAISIGRPMQKWCTNEDANAQLVSIRYFPRKPGGKALYMGGHEDTVHSSSLPNTKKWRQEWISKIMSPSSPKRPPPPRLDGSIWSLNDSTTKDRGILSLGRITPFWYTERRKRYIGTCPCATDTYQAKTWLIAWFWQCWW